MSCVGAWLLAPALLAETICQAMRVTFGYLRYTEVQSNRIFVTVS